MSYLFPTSFNESFRVVEKFVFLGDRTFHYFSVVLCETNCFYRHPASELFLILDQTTGLYWQQKKVQRVLDFSWRYKASSYTAYFIICDTVYDAWILQRFVIYSHLFVLRSTVPRFTSCGCLSLREQLISLVKGKLWLTRFVRNHNCVFILPNY